MKKIGLLAAIAGTVAICAAGQTFEKFKYGDFENWVTRNIKESKVRG